MSTLLPPSLPTTLPATGLSASPQTLENQVRRAHDAVRTLGQRPVPMPESQRPQWTLAERLASVDEVFGQWEATSAADRDEIVG